MSRSMVDAATLPTPAPPADAVAGYLHSAHAAAPWSAQAWTRAELSYIYALPIWVCGPPFNAEWDRADIVPELEALGVPRGCAVVIDVEHYDAARAHAAGYWPRIAGHLEADGWVPVVYCSRTDAALFPGRQWLADWTGHEHELPGAVAVQWNGGVHLAYDSSTVFADTLQLWQPHAQGPGGNPLGWLMANRPQNDGYWLVNEHGEVHAYAGARYRGGFNTLTPPNRAQCTAIVPTASGNGYWLVGADGSIDTFGDALYHGSPNHDAAVAAGAERVHPAAVTAFAPHEAPAP